MQNLLFLAMQNVVIKISDDMLGRNMLGSLGLVLGTMSKGQMQHDNDKNLFYRHLSCRGMQLRIHSFFT